MKEYMVCLDDAQVLFNNILRSARNTIECAFGRLKARWGFLRKTIDIKLESVPIIAYSCFVLHNYCERNKDNGIDEGDIQSQIRIHLREDQNAPTYPILFIRIIHEKVNTHAKC